MEITITKCDRCSPKTDVGVGQWLDAYCLEPINGVFRGTFVEAQNRGWDQREYGTICPACIVEENAEKEVGESVVGLEDLENSLANGIKAE